MPPEILIMCPRCGRPQLARGQACISCGGALAPPVELRPPSARDQLLDAYASAIECDLGMGRRLLLSSRRLEWRPRSGHHLAIELKQLESASMEERPVWESLLLATIGGVGAVLLSGWMRWVALAFTVLALAACFLQRRYGLRLTLRNGQVHRVFLGIGRRHAPLGERIESVWSSVSDALHGLGVKTARRGDRRRPAAASEQAQGDRG